MNELELQQAKQELQTKIQNLPSAWDGYKEKLKDIAKFSIRLKLNIAENLSIWQSKIGGKPYMPKDMTYPTNKEDKPLYLLAQINFSEMPKIDYLPQSGILQFFVAPDDVYGLDFDHPQNQDNFRVIYHKTITDNQDMLQLDVPTIAAYDDEDGYFPIDAHEYAITPILQLQAVPILDDFDKLIVDLNHLKEKLTAEFGESFDFWENVVDRYEAIMETDGHRLGGYPYFTQSDPRYYNKKFSDYILLFQLDSEDFNDGGIMWGDCGVGNFFIHPNDLANEDFSKVMYNWDCC